MTKKISTGSPEYEGPYSSPIYNHVCRLRRTHWTIHVKKKRKLIIAIASRVSPSMRSKCRLLLILLRYTCSLIMLGALMYATTIYVKWSGKIARYTTNQWLTSQMTVRAVVTSYTTNQQLTSLKAACVVVYTKIEGCKMVQEDSTLYNNPEASIPDDRTCGGVYQNKACNMGQEDYPIDNKPAAKTPEDNTYRFINQNKAWKMGQDDCATYDKPAANTSEGNICRCIYQSKAYKWAKKIATSTTNQQLTHQKTAQALVPKQGKQNGPRGLYQTYSQHLKRQFIPGCIPNQGNKNGPRRLQCV